MRLIDSCITQIEAEGPSRTCNERKEEKEKIWPRAPMPPKSPFILTNVESSRVSYRDTSLIRNSPPPYHRALGLVLR